jgi:hypothetical protein
MMTPTMLFFALSVLASLASALPNPLSIRQTPSPETWQIPRLDMHMMTTGTGIPGNPPWPEDSKFNSTIDFDVLVPDYESVVGGTTGVTGQEKWNCQGSMANGTLMEGVAGCIRDGEGEGRLLFGMERYTELGERRPELSFSLWLFRTRYICLCRWCSSYLER